MATVLNVSGLTDYVNSRKDELITKSSLGAKTLEYVEIMPNVKYKDALNYLDSTIDLREAACGWNPGGSDTFSERFIEVKTLEIEKEWCYLDFKKKFMNYQLMFEAGRETLPFEEKLAESNLAAIQDALDVLVWQGNSGLSIDGFISGATAASATTVEFGSGATVVEKVDAVVAACTAKMLKKGVNVFMSDTDFRTYIQESNGTCCANRPIIDAASASITYAGDSRIKLVPVPGLEGTGYIVAATPDALVYGTDIEDADSVWRIWFDEKEQKFDFRVLFNAGTQIKLPWEVVLGA